jgi:hypothetical protein
MEIFCPAPQAPEPTSNPPGSSSSPSYGGGGGTTQAAQASATDTGRGDSASGGAQTSRATPGNSAPRPATRQTPHGNGNGGASGSQGEWIVRSGSRPGRALWGEGPGATCALMMGARFSASLPPLACRCSVYVSDVVQYVRRRWAEPSRGKPSHAPDQRTGKAEKHGPRCDDLLVLRAASGRSGGGGGGGGGQSNRARAGPQIPQTIARALTQIIGESTGQPASSRPRKRWGQ